MEKTKKPKKRQKKSLNKNILYTISQKQNNKTTKNHKHEYKMIPMVYFKVSGLRSKAFNYVILKKNILILQ